MNSFCEDLSGLIQVVRNISMTYRFYSEIGSVVRAIFFVKRAAGDANYSSFEVPIFGYFLTSYQFHYLTNAECDSPRADHPCGPEVYRSDS